MASAVDGVPQVGLVIVTHGTCGECLLAAAADICGPVTRASTVAVSVHEDFNEIVRRVGRACDEVDQGVGVLILVDVHGSSEFQACLAMVDGTRSIEIVCGVNLPMILKLTTVDRKGLSPPEMAELIKEVGKRSIRLGSELTGKIIMHPEEHR
jgi:mannose/fructose-specific phosphotransferase system component IIA